MYSQLDDEAKIIEYFDSIFHGTPGHFLDVGANNGITFSNTRRLIELGWGGVCVEPDPRAFSALILNNLKIDNVNLICGGIGVEDGLKEFTVFEDSLLSSTKSEQITKWSGTPVLRKVLVQMMRWETLFQTVGSDFNFISIDAEGVSFDILKQFPFETVDQIQMFCVEHDSNVSEISRFMEEKKYKTYHINALNGFYVKDK